MPITIVCPECNASMKVRDAFAGTRIRCVGCRTAILVPVLEVPLEMPDEDHSNPSKASTTEHRRENTNVDQLLVSDASTPNAEPSRKAPIPRYLAGWKSFGSGCRFVRIGLWIELIGVCSILALIGSIIVEKLMGVAQPFFLNNQPLVLLALLLPLASGTLLVVLGRVKMVLIPSGTGAVKMLVVASILSTVRFLSLIAATTFVFLAVHQENSPNGNPIALSQYYNYAGRGLGIGFLMGFVAELSLIPAMAVIAATMPSNHLRRRSAMVAFCVQLIALLWFGLSMLGVALQTFDEIVPRDPAPAQVQNPPRGAPIPAAPAPNDNAPYNALAFLIAISMIEFAYTYLHISLYGAGEAATAGIDHYRNRRR